jgi:hypothetical protein
MKKKTYIRISEKEVPQGVRFDTVRRNQGQIIETSYGGFDRYEHDHGDPYMRVEDRSTRTVEFYKLSK